MAFGDAWTPGQRAMAELIDGVASEHCQWPRFDYLDHELQALSLDARQIFESFGVLRDAAPGSRMTYADVTTDRASYLHDESRVGLSVAGYYHLRGESGPAGVFLNMMTAAGDRRASLKISPIYATDIDWTGQDFIDSIAIDLTPSMHWLMTEFIKTEPRGITGLTMRTGFSPPSTWTANIGPAARAFAAMRMTTPQYMERVQQLLAPTEIARPRVTASPLALLTALDYLNVTWLLHCHHPLIRLPGVLEPAALLAADVADKEELSSRLSTLADLFKTIVTHELQPSSLNRAHPLRRLGSYLDQQSASLDDDDRRTAVRALEQLHHIKEVRNGLQHNEKPRQSHESWISLGLPHPPGDWNDLWLLMRSIATESILEVRSVVAKLPRDGCIQHRS